uniref:Uncharacterized protein n=1 Tax=Phlegmariurus squarrosus TaxID=73615 RepID=H9M820_PHLSQ|nr:hypothetical protein HusqMp05 [Phlegmariurus squarrosus]AEV55727.1 hypothetical protein HusqMp05 [Phlegmariurus squarrosus]
MSTPREGHGQTRHDAFQFIRVGSIILNLIGGTACTRASIPYWLSPGWAPRHTCNEVVCVASIFNLYKLRSPKVPVGYAQLSYQSQPPPIFAFHNLWVVPESFYDFPTKPPHLRVIGFCAVTFPVDSSFCNRPTSIFGSCR